ncbi:MAG: Lrp/AsnC family transcriptional regulator [Candidatus Diapherotrites archaeon]|nr:Lrp/AsnC family transcriptional regulator [Candidatus Diapherotrites archaeon]
MTVLLDKIDIVILKALLDDGRASYSAVAKNTNLTDVAVKKRVESLKRKGVIASITANLNYSAIGFEKPLFIQLRTDLSKSKDVFKKLETLENIIEIHQVLGEYNLLLKVVLPSLSAVEPFLARLSAVDGIQDMKSLVVVSQLKQSNSLPSSLAQKKF